MFAYKNIGVCISAKRRKPKKLYNNENNCFVHFENLNNILFFMFIRGSDNDFTDELQLRRYHTIILLFMSNVFINALQ